MYLQEDRVVDNKEHWLEKERWVLSQDVCLYPQEDRVVVDTVDTVVDRVVDRMEEDKVVDRKVKKDESRTAYIFYRQAIPSYDSQEWVQEGNCPFRLLH